MSTRAVAAQSGSTPVDMENRPKSTASQLSQGSDVSQVSTQQPLLSLACTFTSPALDSKLSSQDNFSNMWTVLTKCKDVVKDGRRLENVCWRLWYQACLNSGLRPGCSISKAGQSSSSSSSPPPPPLSSSIESRSSSIDDQGTDESSGWESASDTESMEAAPRHVRSERLTQRTSSKPDYKRDPRSGSVTPRRIDSKTQYKSPSSRDDTPSDDGFVTTDGEYSSSEAGQDSPISMGGKQSAPIKSTSTCQRPATTFSSTPKASSYPTPAGSLLDVSARTEEDESNDIVHGTPQFKRTRSHMQEYQSSRGSEAERAGIKGEKRMKWDGSKWSSELPHSDDPRERNFGQVLRLVFGQDAETETVNGETLRAARVASTSSHRGKDAPSNHTAERTPESGPAVPPLDLTPESAAQQPSSLPITSNKSPSNGVPSLKTVPDRESQGSDRTRSSSATTSLATTSLSPRGPEVRLVEPTPVPSRVGSLGDSPAPVTSGLPTEDSSRPTTLSPSVSEPSHPSSNPTGPSLAAKASRSAGLVPMTTITPQASSSRLTTASVTKSNPDVNPRTSPQAPTIESPSLEKDDPIAAAGRAQALTGNTTQKVRRLSKGMSQNAQRLSASALRQLGESHGLRSSTLASSGTSSNKRKEKKSIFFIQGGSHDRRRHGSISATSDASTNDGSTVIESSVGTRTTHSPVQAARSTGRFGTSPLASNVSTSVTNDPSPTPSARQAASDEAVVQTSVSPRPAPTNQSGPSRSLASSKSPNPTHGRRRSSGAAAAASRRSPRDGKPSGAGLKNPAHAQVMKNHAPKRVPSASNMAGKFANEKARAASAIAARLEAQQQLEKERQQEARDKLLASKRQKSEPNFAGAQARLESQLSGEDGDESFETVGEDETDDQDDDEGWSSATDSPKAVKASIQPDPARYGARKRPSVVQGNNGKALTPAQIQAAEEGQRKRELFAKRAIFGTSGTSALSSMAQGAGKAQAKDEVVPASRPGLLSNLFETQRDVVQRNTSSVDLTRTPSAETAEPHPSATNQLGLAMSRSKSSVAVPATNAVSVERDDMMDKVAALEAAAAKQEEQGRRKLRLPPKPVNAAELSECSSPEEDSNMLKPSSVALRRLEEISGRKSRQDLTRISHSSSELPVDPKEATNSSQAVPAAASASMAPLPDLALPQTPTTRRRQMLATELPEDLRMNLIWERRSRAPLYPSKRQSDLRATSSALDLTETARHAENASNVSLSRQNTEPVAHRGGDSVARDESAQRRRASNNVLGGGNRLRPLTNANSMRSQEQTATTTTTKVESKDPAPHGNLANNRSKSAADMSQWNRSNGHGQDAIKPPDVSQDLEQGWARNRRLRQREGELSSSFRSHGW